MAFGLLLTSHFIPIFRLTFYLNKPIKLVKLMESEIGGRAFLKCLFF